jgi:hypothetical protein
MANINLSNEFSESDDHFLTSALFLPHFTDSDDKETNKEYNNENLLMEGNADDLNNFLTKDLVDLIDEIPINECKQENKLLPSLTLDSDSDEEFKTRKNSNLSSFTKNASFSTVNTLDEKELNNETNNISTTIKESSDNIEDKPEKKPFIQREGDWDCMKCKNMNFAFRAHCNRCKCSKVDSELLKAQQAKSIATCFQYAQMMQLRMMTMIKMSQIKTSATQSMNNINPK